MANQFNDYTILQISDLHNKDFGDNNKKLINKIINLSLDMIVITGDLVAPNQSFFPKYDAGLFEDGNTKMIVSRGLGNSIVPFRIFNKPELVHITLKVVGR